MSLGPFLYRRSALIFDHKTGKQQVSRFNPTSSLAIDRAVSHNSF